MSRLRIFAILSKVHYSLGLADGMVVSENSHTSGPHTVLAAAVISADHNVAGLHLLHSSESISFSG